MHFDSAPLLQISSEFFERRVGLVLDLPAQQPEALVIEGGRVAAAVRLRGETLAGTVAVEQTGDGAAVNFEG